MSKQWPYSLIVLENWPHLQHKLANYPNADKNSFKYFIKCLPGMRENTKVNYTQGTQWPKQDQLLQERLIITKDYKFKHNQTLKCK